MPFVFGRDYLPDMSQNSLDKVDTMHNVGLDLRDKLLSLSLSAAT
jgi:hypothetical protein